MYDLLGCYSHQQRGPSKAASPTFLAPGTGFVEGFCVDWGGGGCGFRMISGPHFASMMATVMDNEITPRLAVTQSLGALSTLPT